MKIESTYKVTAERITVGDLLEFCKVIEDLPPETPVSIAAFDNQRDGRQVTLSVTRSET